MELPEANKSSAADEPENKEKANWMQVREAVTYLINQALRNEGWGALSRA
jgi:hypothetical protein